MPLVRLQTLDGLSDQAVTDDTIAILPVGATEAHGPHLPETTDCDIADGHLNALANFLSSDIDAIVLPVQRTGASREHLWAGNTQSAEENVLLNDWFAIARAVSQMQIRRLVVVSSHGGNSAVVDSLILKARAELGMLAIATAWLRFGYPEGLFSEDERRFGIHGGDIETSLMLHYAPERVLMEKAGDFASALAQIESGMHHLTAYGRHRFGWLSCDLNPHGVMGNAAAATAAKGAVLADHILGEFAALLDDARRFDLAWLK